MLNLYEVLEVSERASKEVIEKAYRVLAKKYHPDLQKEEEKKNAEIKMKQINEAYEVLSNDEKRKNYDLELEQLRQEEKRIEEINRQKQEENKKVQHYENTNYQKREIAYKNKTDRKKSNENYAQNLQNELKKVYNQAYYDYLRSTRL